MAHLDSRPVAATTFIVGEDSDLIAASDLVLEGKVESVRNYPTGAGVERLARVRILQVLRGTVSSTDRVVVRLPGGVYRGKAQIIFGTPVLRPEEQVLLFLRQNHDGTYAITRMAEGKYRLFGTDPDAIAVRDLEGASAVRARGSRLVERGSRDARRLGDLRESVRAGGLRQSERALIARAFIRPGGDFSLLGTVPGRWDEPDRGEPVTYVIGRGDTGGLDADWVVSQALAAWSAAGCSPLSLEVAGSADPAPSAACDGQSQIVFGDPFDEIEAPSKCAGILGVGSFCTTGNSRIIGHTAFNRISEGDVVINTGFEGCPFWNEIDLSEVLAHEIGHTLGLGHSSEYRGEEIEEFRDAIMYYRAHLDGRGAALMSDDREGICFVYPGPETADGDADGVEDELDNCVAVANDTQSDRDSDGQGDPCDEFMLDQATLFVEPPAVKGSRVKVAATVRPPVPFDPGSTNFTLDIVVGYTPIASIAIPPGAWRSVAGGKQLSARLVRPSGVFTVRLVRHEDGSYKLRANARRLRFDAIPDGEPTVQVNLGNYQGVGHLEMLPR
jgi:hypothetical protein